MSTEMIQQFQAAKYAGPIKALTLSSNKRAPTPDLPEPPPGYVAYQVLSRKKEVILSPKAIEMEGNSLGWTMNNKNVIALWIMHYGLQHCIMEAMHYGMQC